MPVAPVIGKKLHAGDSAKAIGMELDRRAHAYVNDVDLSRSGENEVIKVRDTDTAPVPLDEAIERRIGELHTKRKIRKDAVRAVGFIVSSNDALDDDAAKRFLHDSIDWFGRRYGRENLLAAAIHMDEGTPHAQLWVCPVVHDDATGYDRLSAKELFAPDKRRKDKQTGKWEVVSEGTMTKLQTAFWQDVARGYGYDRPLTREQRDKGYRSVEAYKAHEGAAREAKAAVAQARAEADAARKDRDDALGELAAATTAAQQAVRQAADAAAEQAAAERERDTARAEEQQARKDRDAARAEADAARAWADTASASEERQAARLSEAWEQREAEERRRDQAQARADAAEKAADASVRAAEAKSARECASAEKAAQKARESLKQVRGEVAAAEAERDAAQADAASARGDRDAAQAELDGLRDDAAMMRAQVEAGADTIADQQAELSVVRSRYGALAQVLGRLSEMMGHIMDAVEFVTAKMADKAETAIERLSRTSRNPIIADATAPYRAGGRVGLKARYRLAQAAARKPLADAVESMRAETALHLGQPDFGKTEGRIQAEREAERLREQERARWEERMAAKEAEAKRLYETYQKPVLEAQRMNAPRPAAPGKGMHMGR